MSINQHERLAAETEEQREIRLQHLSINQHERLATETEEQRDVRLQRLSINQHERLATETEEQRDVRLQRLSINQHERLATETEEQREVRLQQLSINQRERLAAETEEQREDRLQRISERETPATDQPFKQRSVQMKMRRFHDYFASLSSPSCSTCSESFPCIQLHSSTTESLRCHRDKHTPKLYSSTNNMNPGLQPPQLQVSVHVYIYTIRAFYLDFYLHRV